MHNELTHLWEQAFITALAGSAAFSTPQLAKAFAAAANIADLAVAAIVERRAKLEAETPNQQVADMFNTAREALTKEAAAGGLDESGPPLDIPEEPIEITEGGVVGLTGPAPYVARTRAERRAAERAKGPAK